MPKKNKTPEEHLQVVEYLLAGLILKRDVNLNQVAKIVGCKAQTLSKMYPERKERKRKK